MIKQKLIKKVLPFLLDSYVCHMDRVLSDNELKHPKGWKASRDCAFKLSNLLKTI